MKPLRLCFVGPANNVTTRRWVEWFTTRGHHTTVLTVEPIEDEHHFTQIDLTYRHGGRKVGRLLSAAQLTFVIRKLRPDIVHAHYLRGLAWGLPLVRSCPVVVTPWGSDVLEEQGAFKEWYSRHLTRSVLTAADLVVVHSRYMEDRVRPLLNAGAQVARIGWGVNLHMFRAGLDVEPLRRRWNLGPDRLVIFSPRLAQPCYRHDLVIRAFSLVRKQLPNAALVLSGQFADIHYLNMLHRLVSDLHLDEHVRFLGPIPYSEMPSWMNLADIMVMVPQSDGMPNTLWEAMACGAFPVLIRLPQYDEVIQDQLNGCFVEPNPESLAHVLSDALANHDLRTKAKERNRSLVQAVANQDHEMAAMERCYGDLREAWLSHEAVGA